MSDLLDPARALLASQPRKCDELTAKALGWKSRNRPRLGNFPGGIQWFHPTNHQAGGRYHGCRNPGEPSPEYVSHAPDDPDRWRWLGEMWEALRQGATLLTASERDGVVHVYRATAGAPGWRHVEAASLPHAFFLALVASGKVLIP